VLTGERLFDAKNEARTMARLLSQSVRPPSELVPELSPLLDAVVLRGLARDPAHRFATAKEMALHLEQCGIVPAPAWKVGEWVSSVARTALAEKAERVAALERFTSATNIRVSRPALRTAPEQGSLRPVASDPTDVQTITSKIDMVVP